MKNFQLKFLPLLVLIFGTMFFLSSCSKENVDETIVEEEDLTPNVEDGFSFKLFQDGVEVFDKTATLNDNSECLFGRAIEYFDSSGSVAGHMYTIGTSADFQLLWEQEGDLAPHTFVAEPDVAGGISFILLDPCTQDAGEVISLRNHTITLDEVGDVDEIMSGTFEGEMAIGSGGFVTMTGSFSVPRIQ